MVPRASNLKSNWRWRISPTGNEAVCYDSYMKESTPTIAGYLELLQDSAASSDRLIDGSVAIYVHIPFCSYLCTYCDFDTFVGRLGWIEPYVDAVVRQIRCSPRVRASSLYLGGGTPSLLSTEEAARIVQACREQFALDPETETALEGNPHGLSLERLVGLRAAGFNRLSLGLQSTDARLLRLLGRRHREADAAAVVDAARSAGFRNLSLDLLFGVPLQDLEMWRSTLETVITWGVEHISCYALTVETGTPMERGVTRGTLHVPPDEAVVEMYELAGESLKAAGYRRYEISNWALPGYESAHNLVYWRNQSYLGIGAGAAGCWDGRRYKIAPTIEGYVEGVNNGRIPLVEGEQIDARRAMSDTLILGLRLEEGVSRAAFRGRYGVDPEASFGEALAWAREWGLLEDDGQRLRLTHQGVLLSNELFERLL